MTKKLTEAEREMHVYRIRAAALKAARIMAEYEAVCIYEETGMAEYIEAEVTVEDTGIFTVNVKHTPRL